MKTLLLALCLYPLYCASLHAETTEERLQHYEALAVKLYPDSAVADSPFGKLISRVEAVMEVNHSWLLHKMVSSRLIVLHDMWMFVGTDIVGMKITNLKFLNPPVAVPTMQTFSGSNPSYVNSPQPSPSPSASPSGQTNSPYDIVFPGKH